MSRVSQAAALAALADQDWLEQVKTQLKAGLLRALDSNMGMARQLAEYDAKTGSKLYEKNLSDIISAE